MDRLSIVGAVLLIVAHATQADQFRKWPEEVSVDPALKEQVENDPAVGKALIKSGTIRTVIRYNGSDYVTTARYRNGLWVSESEYKMLGGSRNKAVMIYRGLTGILDNTDENNTNPTRSISYSEGDSQTWPPKTIKLVQKYRTGGYILSCKQLQFAVDEIKGFPGGIYKMRCEHSDGFQPPYFYNVYYSDFFDYIISVGGTNGAPSPGLSFQAEAEDHLGHKYNVSFTSPMGELF
ncbi:hypothetical protein [Pseudomonas sp. KCJK9058]|uniref:hypothetical protein n=1 Tax=Pseudomonas sp. KCJK9058 TaxID=3344563 RepID=UPI0039058725